MELKTPQWHAVRHSDTSDEWGFAETYEIRDTEGQLIAVVFTTEAHARLIASTPQRALDNLARALVEDVLTASDEEILAEFREDHGDPARNAEEMRALFDAALAKATGEE